MCSSEARHVTLYRVMGSSLENTLEDVKKWSCDATRILENVGLLARDRVS